ncbi:MAG: class I SAM-dependent methyltransferase [Planctomycetes bacterium]|nr:class I SAM-dependent methyltransferase [Planctomycetota bacterium]
MPMTQTDIRAHYEQDWAQRSENADGEQALRYSDPVEDAILYPAYTRLVEDLGLRVDGGRVLDVGAGSGRWIRFFRERYAPATLMGIDYTAASVALLERWHGGGDPATAPVFRHADITDPGIDLGAPYDLVNVANVLFHIPEPELFTRALANLARLVAPGGAILTTEYLPHTTMRTQWMLVRSRYEFGAAVEAAGLQIAAVRPFGFFTNDPFGIDGPDDGPRAAFGRVREGVRQLFASSLDEPTRAFFVDLMTDIERATLAFAADHVAPEDLPAQKLVALRRATDRT